MTTCIQCGREIPDGELFCAGCDPERQQAEKPAYSPKMTYQPQSVKKSAARPAKRRKAPTMLIPFLLMTLLFLLAAGLCVWQIRSRDTERVQMRLRESEVELKQADMKRLQKENESLTGRLEEASKANREQAQRIEELQTRLNSAESTVSQSQYDISEQQAELVKAQQENGDLRLQLSEAETARGQLETELTELQKLQEELQKAHDALQEQVTLLETKTKFVDSYVVFVENDGTSLYHKYGCSCFKQKSFWAYSRKLAESYGYLPCPLCCG